MIFSILTTLVGTIRAAITAAVIAAAVSAALWILELALTAVYARLRNR